MTCRKKAHFHENRKDSTKEAYEKRAEKRERNSMIITQLELLFYDTQNLGREPQCVRRKVSICAGWPHIEDAFFGFALKGQITASAPAFKPKAENSDCDEQRPALSLSLHAAQRTTQPTTRPSPRKASSNNARHRVRFVIDGTSAVGGRGFLLPRSVQRVGGRFIDLPPEQVPEGRIILRTSIRAERVL